MREIKKLEKILLMLVVVALICGVSTITKATGDVDELIGNIPQYNSTNNTTDNTTNNTTNNTSLGNTNVNITNTTTLPKTGVNDTGMWILVAGCVILAIYTYKKVRNYKD